MEDDFLDAHQRHWQDAELLFREQRWANADHLYGIAAECGLKALTEVCLGTPLGKGQKRHVMEPSKPDNAWTIFQRYQSGRIAALCFSLPIDNPFQDWDVGQRYAAQSRFNQSIVLPHQQGTLKIHRFIQQAQRERLL